MTPTLNELPPAPPGKTGWPWSVEAPRLPATRPDRKPWPRISIVTPSYNQGQFIEETIRSVLLQGYPKLEYQILDGGSNDRSVEIIRRYEPWLSYWHSEKDGGQATAINSGLSRATGVWFQNINSDDVLENATLACVGAMPLSLDIVYGDVLEFCDEQTHLVRNSRPAVSELIAGLYRSDRFAWHQPGVFLKREHMLSLGGYDPSLSYLFDFDLIVRYVEQYPKSARIDSTLVKFRIHPNAKSSAWRDVYFRESIAARELLAEKLLRPENRKTALHEARRRRIISEISCAAREDQPGEHAHTVLRLLASDPALALDRMFIGAVRRRPKFWFNAAASGLFFRCV